MGKIEAGNVTTRSITVFSRRGAGWKKKDLLFTFLYFFIGDETVPMKEGFNGVMAFTTNG